MPMRECSLPATAPDPTDARKP